LAEHPGIKLIVIDSLSRFRAPATKNTPQFEQDYAVIGNLQNVAKDHPGLCIVVIHHTTKANFDDPLDSISGTYGVTAACDAYGVLQRKGEQYKLHWGGRLWDQDANDFEIARDGGRWVMVGTWDAETSGLTPVRKEIYAALQAEGTITTRGIARRFDIADSTASEHLHSLMNNGLVSKKGSQWIASASPSTNTYLKNLNTKYPKKPKAKEKVSVFKGFGTQNPHEGTA
jgi:predicted DNA-binding transcriptional regulator